MKNIFLPIKHTLYFYFENYMYVCVFTCVYDSIIKSIFFVCVDLGCWYIMVSTTIHTFLPGRRFPNCLWPLLVRLNKLRQFTKWRFQLCQIKWTYHPILQILVQIKKGLSRKTWSRCAQHDQTQALHQTYWIENKVLGYCFLWGILWAKQRS